MSAIQVNKNNSEFKTCREIWSDDPNKSKQLQF